MPTFPTLATLTRATAVALAFGAAGAANAAISFVTSANNPAFLSGSTDTFNDLAINTDLQTLSRTRETQVLPK